MAKIISNVATTETFSAWLDKTNQLASSFANVVSVDSTNPATFPQGTAGVNGVLIANTLTVTTGLLTANASANIVGSANVTVAVNVGANVTANTSALKVGNSTVNSIITSTTASVGSNVVANTSALLIGNSSVNTVITSSSIDTDGSLSVLGATSISNTLGAGNTTITGFANVSSTLAAGDTTINGFINVSSTANVGGAVNLRSTLAVNGAVTVPNTAALGNTTVTGFINVSTTANVGGATNLRGDATVNGALTVVNTAAVGNTTVTGFINVSTTANVGGATNLRSTLVVNGAVTIANSVASGNNDLTGYINVSTTANVGGATNLRSTLVVNGAVTIANTLSSGNTSTANLSVTGFANVSGTANVGGAVNLRDTLAVNGAVTIANTLSSGNTSTANLSVTGFANVSGTANVGGATNLRSTLVVNGAVTIANTLSSGNTSTANLSVTGFANISSTLAAGDTTITGFANVSGTANVGGATNLRSTLDVVGATAITNTLSSGNTSTANLSVTGFANVSGTANVGGATNLRSTLVVNGAVTIANTLSSGNTSTADLSVTGFANVSGTANVGGATTLRSTLAVNGAVTIANTLSSGNTSTANLSVTGFANVSSTLAAGNTTITGFANVSTTANVGGATNLRSTLDVVGATAITNTLAAGNTTITGFANISTTANVGGATNLRSTLDVVGATAITNTLSSGNTSTANLSVTGFANVSSTLAAGNTTITGFVNVSTTANVGGATNLRSTLDVVGATAITNTLSSGNTSTANLSVTGFANISGTVNVGGATNLRSTLDVVGATAITNTLSSGNTTVNNLTVNGTINRNPTITLGGDLVGSVTLTDLQSGTLNATIVPDAVALGTDTTGNYVANVAGANGISSIAVGVGKINGSTTTITAGDGLTVFQRDLNIGSIIQVSNSSTSEIRSVTAIASNTSMTVNAAFNTALVNASSNIVYSVVNPTGEGSIPTIRVVPNTGIVANAAGVFVNSAYIATISANNASYLNGELPAYYTNATNISTGTLAVARGGTGVGTSTGTGSVVLSASPTFTGNAEFANIALTGVINANNSIGSAGQVLRTDGTGKAYWGPAVTAQDGTLTDINAGVGLVKGGTSTVPSLAVVANNGIIASTDGVFVKPHTGIIVNTDGVSVNAAYIATISANNASNFGGELPAYYTNATNISTGTLAVARGGTGATTFTAGALLKGNGTSAVSVASAADIVAAIGTTRVANATYADSSGSAGSATTATRATNSDNALVTNDNASAGTFYPVWVDATSGDKPIKLSSTKLTFNPSTGRLTATSFSGSGAALTSLDADNISAGTLPVGRGGTGVTTSTGTTSVVLSASPTLTGIPLAPTATADTNSNQIATTAYVIGQGYLKSGTAASTYLPLAGGTVTGNLIVSGNLTIDGTTTNIHTTNLVVEDKNIILGDITTPSNTTADGGGITLNGATNKTLNWVNATGAWTSSEDFNLLTGKVYEINGTTVLSSSALGSGVTGSSLTSVDTITIGVWQGTAVAVAHGGTGATSAPGARTNLGASTLGGNIFTISNPNAITFPRFNADNTVSALSAADFRIAIGETNTTYDLLSVANTTANEGLINLIGSNSTTDTGKIIGQDEIVVSSNSTAVYVDHADVARTNNTSAASPASGGNFTAIDSITTNARGHVTAINTKTVTLPVDPNTTYDLATVANTVANEGLINLIGSNSTTDTGKIIGQDEIVVSSNPTAVYIDHADVTRTNNTSNESPASGGTFTAIDSITTNARGHVTAINTKTVTIPVDPDTNTTYDLLSVANTEANKGILRLDPLSGDTDDDVFFVGQDDIVVSSITGTIQIDHADITRTDNTTTASPASGGTFTAIDSITTNARGHVTAINTKTVTLPVDPDTNTTYDLLTVANTTQGVVRLASSGNANDNINFVGAGGVTVTSDDSGAVTITGQVGDITAVTAGAGLSGGGSSGDVALAVDNTVIRITGDQSMADTKTFSGALAVTGTMSINNANGSEGGEFRMQKPVTGSTISGDLVVDLVGNALRIFEASGTNRGVSVDITGGGASVGSALLHSTNYNTYAPTLTGGGASGNWTINITGNAGTVTSGVYTGGDQTIGGTKTFSSTISGSINGNAGTVTNGVYTTGDQTIGGTKTFSSTISGSINGNAGTVTNGVYTTGDQTIGGTKTFSSTILLANGGFMFSSDGSQDTGINWASDGVMNVRSNGQTIGQFNSTGFTGTAGAVAWTNVSGRPTAVSSFTNDSGYITSAGRAFPRRSDGGDLNFYWSGQLGQPTWLWGGNDGTNMYVYNPSNFSVNYATSAGSAGSVTNGVYTTGDQTIGGTKTFSGVISASRVFAGYDSGTTNSISCSGWFRSNEASGWFNATHGGGINMEDATYVRVYGSKKFYVANDIDATGNITAYFSDERLKTKVGKITDAIEKVQKLEGFYYVENEKAKDLGYTNEATQVGVSAQQVQSVLPEVIHMAPVDVAIDEDGNKYSKTGENYITVDYSRLVPLLIEAVKEQQEQINSLKEEIRQLKGN